MQLLVIRHAIAEEREDFAKSGQPDSERPLTDYGRRRMRRNARGLLRIAERPSALATSPYARAAETAHIVADTLGITSIEVVDALTPDRHPKDLVPWLSRYGADDIVGVVGHEPHLGVLITWLLTGRQESRTVLKKGGACLLDLGRELEAGAAVLHWLLTPAQLRAIGD
jgi:phosphohistidine phosphatase